MGPRKSRRFVIKGYGGSSAWFACTFAYSCATLQAAERCFEKVRDKLRDGRANADAILLIDRQKDQVLEGTTNPTRLGW
jgi:hypothetical protein